MVTGWACRTEFQNAAGVWPDSRRPGAVGDGAGDHHRHVDAARLASFRDGVDRRLGVERVENRLDQQQVGAAVDQACAPARHRRRATASKVTARKPGLLTSGEIDAVRLVGPSAPATKRRRPSSFSASVGRLAREPRARDVELVGDVLHAVVGLGDRGGGERVGRDDVGAGAEISEMDVAHRVRPAEVQQVVVAAHLAVPGVEARAAIALLVELERLDHGAHGAVEHQDALASICSSEDGSRAGVGRITTVAPDYAACSTAGRRPSRWQIA